VIAGFHRGFLVRPIVLKDSAQRGCVLRHEQTPFDLAEVHAAGCGGYSEISRPPAQRADAELNGWRGRSPRRRASNADTMTRRTTGSWRTSSGVEPGRSRAA